MKMINAKTTNFTKEDLIRDYLFSSKHPNLFEIGLEYERISLNKNNTTANYFGEKGIENFLKAFSKKYNWEPIFEDNHIIGLKNENSTTITLEPGGQLEISLKPQKNVCDIEKEIEILNKKINTIAKKFDLSFIEYGINPTCKATEIAIIPKRRYQTMANHLDLKMSKFMMRQTSGIQTAFDFENEADAAQKITLSIKLSPIVTAIFANSPIYNKKLTKYKSIRSLAWIYTDKQRCGLLNEDLLENFSFSKYINYVFKIPVIFIVRDNKIIEFDKKTTFEDFFNFGYEGLQAKKEDYELHSSLFFPDVRLKNYIEIRNHDCQNGILKYAIPTFYKGVFKDINTFNSINTILNQFTFEELNKAKLSSAKYGLKGYLGNYQIQDIACDILKLSFNALENDHDQKYLIPILNLTLNGLSPADIIISKYNDLKSDFNKFMEYLKK